jgi:hypothetical protein
MLTAAPRALAVFGPDGEERGHIHQPEASRRDYVIFVGAARRYTGTRGGNTEVTT